MMKRKKIVWQFALLSLLLLALAACGGSETTTETDTSASEAVVEEVPVVEAATEAAPVAEEAVEEAPAAVEEAVSEEVAPAEELAVEEPVAEIVVVENTKLNLNEASGDDFLNTIPGFGNRMVREFQEYRPYISILQFRREIGKYVDDATVAGYEEYVYVPVDVNESDAATLMQLPGVDETIADSLMAARPFDSNDAFLATLATFVSAEQASAAAGYLTGE
ncbi:MAG: hypothetical protein KC445_08195 [Anaerolineales bacterium]|nr:hypothetical protein [Anaerolineales bacterium]